MQLQYRALHAEHLKFLKPVDVQTEEYNALLTDEGLYVIGQSTGLSAWYGSKCVGLAGIHPVWQGRAEAWVVFGTGWTQMEAFGRMPDLIGKMGEFVQAHPAHRVEMTCKVDNIHGRKLARALNFGNPATGKRGEPEARLHKFHPDGTDMYMFARL